MGVYIGVSNVAAMGDCRAGVVHGRGDGRQLHRVLALKLMG